MKLKNGVTVLGLQPQLLLALLVAQDAYKEYNTEVVITSGNDGQHAANSRHYAGTAIDLRVNSLPDPKSNGEALALRIGTDLGRDFDVIFEGDHIHIEYDPRRPL